ncbi:MAG: PaaI family thioesterase [Rhodocyclaceae bacterium]
MKSDRPVFEARDPGYAARIRESFARQNAMMLIGARLEAVAPGFTEIHLPCTDALTQQHGYIHGGIVGMIADSAAGYAAGSLTDADTGVLTVEYKINLVAPAVGDMLVARGTVIRPGRTLLITRADVFAVRGATWTLCATMQQTIMAIPGKQENAAPRLAQRAG